MASNGTYVNGEYFNAGSGTWSALTSGWSGFTDWSSNPTQLQYTKVFDFGVKKPAIPTVILNVPEGAAYLTITYGDALDGGTGEVSGGTTMGGSLYFDLDYCVSGYTSDTYTGFSARYAQIDVYAINRNADNTANITAVIQDVVTEFDQRLEHEYFFDIDSSTLAGTAAARTIPVQKLSTPVAGITYSTKFDASTSAANGKYAIHTVSKSTPSFTVRDLDAFPEDTTGIDHDGIDIDVVGFPTLTATEGGGVGRAG